MTSLAIHSAAIYSMMQLTSQNGFMRSLSGGYKMTVYTHYSLRMEGETIKEVRGKEQ